MTQTFDATQASGGILPKIIIAGTLVCAVGIAGFVGVTMTGKTEDGAPAAQEAALTPADKQSFCTSFIADGLESARYNTFSNASQACEVEWLRMVGPAADATDCANTFLANDYAAYGGDLEAARAACRTEAGF